MSAVPTAVLIADASTAKASTRRADRANGNATGEPSRSRPPRKKPQNPRGPASGAGAVASPATASSSSNQAVEGPPRNNPRRRRENNGSANPNPPNGASVPAPDDNWRGQNRLPGAGGRRGAKFNAGLTTNEAQPAQQQQQHQHKAKNVPQLPLSDDLTSRLIRDFASSPYPECPICYSALHPAQPTWSCSPLTPISSVEGVAPEDFVPGPELDATQCCWSTFHVKCIRSWASKSVKDLEDAWRARGEHRKGEWRCPGCQAKREIVPSGYICFCGSTPEPKPPRLATPHSCANSCSRPRQCGHACPLACHPGPCPPCQVTSQLPCHCGSKIMSFKCAHLNPKKMRQIVSASNSHGVDISLGADLSCGKACGKKLACGTHECASPCHPGDCAPCEVKEAARCYCGKTEKEIGCGEGKEKECGVEGSPLWKGRFECEQSCERLFDCGVHTCSLTCHPPSRAAPTCPRSPTEVTHCPCGKHALHDIDASHFPPTAVLSRNVCTDPIPTCTSLCMKPLASCSHVCGSKCHTGPCPPCSIMLVRPCRCGSSTADVRCSSIGTEGQSEDKEILCDRACLALRACGRHQCNRICCPLAALAGPAKGKGKKRAIMPVVDDTDQTGLHACDLVCGKPLGCGNHVCEARDHRGACPPCLRSTFEEVFCYCTRTMLDPPIPCGTKINCTYPCTRDPPACGHPRTVHACHEDPMPCPPCPFLTNKNCACGKKLVGNIRCSQEKVSCGTTCGKPMACGFHTCDKLCHGGDCGSCTAPCGKSRRLCLPPHHACTLPCHAPSTCVETEPCTSMVTLTCPCGRVCQPIQCGKSTSNPGGRVATSQLKCTNECNIAKRNARLADALGISGDSRETSNVEYNDGLMSFARANVKFIPIVEKAFADFITSERKTQVLPHMPPDRRKFVHDLAAVYRCDTQLIDQEPHRSVQLIRRVDSRVPSPLLSVVIQPLSSSPGLGRLADLRTSKGINSAWRPPVSTIASAAQPTKGWASRQNTAVPIVRPSSATTSSATPPSRAGPPRFVARSLASTPTPATPVPPPMLSPNVPRNWEDD